MVKGQLELKSYIRESLPERVQLKEQDMAEVATTEEKESLGFFARFKKDRLLEIP